jgi:hypothetical protein
LENKKELIIPGEIPPSNTNPHFDPTNRFGMLRTILCEYNDIDEAKHYEIEMIATQNKVYLLQRRN